MRKNADLAYLAGVFDGEGCISISANKSRGWSVDCIVGMAGGYLPHLFRWKFGGSLFKKTFPPSSSNWHSRYEWRVSNKQALNFLEALLPYLKLKRPQAELAIEFQKRKDRYSHYGPKGMPRDERAYREAQCTLMRRLKDQSYGDFEYETLGFAQAKEVKHARAKGGQLEFPLEGD